MELLMFATLLILAIGVGEFINAAEKALDFFENLKIEDVEIIEEEESDDKD